MVIDDDLSDGPVTMPFFPEIFIEYSINVNTKKLLSRKVLTFFGIEF